MESSDTIKMKIKKFEEKDLSLWKSKVTNGLMFLDIDCWLEEEADTDKKENIAMQKKALSFIWESLADNMFRKY